MKQPWRKPELVVLLRMRPNEVVLGDCKSQLGHGPEDTGRTPGCMNVTGWGACRGCERNGS